MKQDEFVTRVCDAVKSEVQGYLEQQPVREVVSVDWMEALVRGLVVRLAGALFEQWAHAVGRVALEQGRQCPGCGRRRKCKRRAGQPMELWLLGLNVALPKLYLECECGAPGVSITRLLTGLSSGEESVELELAAAYCAAEHSYGKASRDLWVHHGQAVERTKVRRMAIEAEREALRYAEAQRVEALRRVEQEKRVVGPERLMVQGDGGAVRTGKLVACERGDAGYGKKTAKTGRARRKRDTQFREVITLDVREPGETEASALDVVVPVVAAEGERSRRMLALAARKGLGNNTKVFGLGDMGSSLAEAFDEAFVDYESVYSADWTHTGDYVRQAARVLEGLDVVRWVKAMKGALWNRQRRKVDKLIEQAREHRMTELPAQFDKCPVHALSTYVRNNWERFNARSFREQGLDFVSGRAEAQVRERTKPRFRVPGAWRHENLEGKATLRAIIAEGRWPAFREHYLRVHRRRFDWNLDQRLRAAVAEGRLRPDCLTSFGVQQTAPEVHAQAA